MPFSNKTRPEIIIPKKITKIKAILYAILYTTAKLSQTKLQPVSQQESYATLQILQILSSP